MSPQSALSQAIARESLVITAHRALWIQQVRRETLEQVNLCRSQVLMPQLHLRVGPGEFKHPMHIAELMVLIGESESLFPRRRNRRGEGDDDRFTGRYFNRAPQ